jgi:hypothetical protein
MAGPVILLILVAAGERSELTGAMAGATQDVLGARAHVVVREVPGEPSDVTALETEAKESATAVVEISWVDSRHQRANLKLHLAASGRWIERTIGFAPSDADTERGRTLGFAIASILPRDEEPPQGGTAATAAGAPSDRTDGGARAAGSKPAPTTLGRAPPSAPQAPAAGPSQGGSTPGGPRREARPRWAVDATAIATTGFYGSGLGFGGDAGLRWFAIGPVALRAGFLVQAGRLSPLNAQSLTKGATLGLALDLWETTLERPLGVAVRVDYAAVDQVITFFPRSGSAQSHDFDWQSGFACTVEGGWLLAPPVQVLVDAGVLDVNGASPNRASVNHGDNLTTLPPLRVGAGVGVRLDL